MKDKKLIGLGLRLAIEIIILIGSVYGMYLYFFTPDLQGGVNTYLFFQVWSATLPKKKDD